MAKLAREMRDQWEKGLRWLQERWRAFERWLERLFRFAGPAGAAAGSVFSKAFAAIFILLGGWLIAWLIRNFWIQRQRRMAQQRTAFDEAEDEEAMITEPNAWMQQAEDFASSQDYRRAFRAVFLAILLLLDQAEIVEFDRARTDGDYLRLVRRKNLNSLYHLLSPLVLEFDRRWYGRSETGPGDYRRIQQEFARVRELITEPP